MRIKRSVLEWNRWRENHEEIQPDLSGTDLNRASLREAYLRRVNLNRANLIGADLREADLREANLYGIYLSKANLIKTNLVRAYLNRASLCEADLREADLREANLYGAYLSKANLIKTNLREADLRKSDLREADLSEANLSGADLSGANLMKSNLHKTDLSGANLSGTDLSGADLSQTIMTNCFMGGTLLAFTDLSIVQGLDTIRHRNKSALDLNSVILPHGSTRTTVLRGVGYPETLVDYYDALFTQPLQYHSLFISYSHKDEVFAQRLYHDLQERGVRCWFAPHDLRPGDYYHKRIDKAIQVHDKVLLLLSEHSVQSTWVEHEVMGALGREKRERREILFPLRLDDTVMEAQTDWAQALRDTRHIGDMTGWQQNERYQAVFQEVVRHLKVGLIPPSK